MKWTFRFIRWLALYVSGMKGFAYIASPYSHPTSYVMQERFNQVESYTAQCMKNNMVVFSPIVHCHTLAQNYKLPTHFDFWQKYCLGMLAFSTELFVLKMEGWEDSKGVQSEIQFAKRIGLPIIYIDMVNCPWKGVQNVSNNVSEDGNCMPYFPPYIPPPHENN